MPPVEGKLGIKITQGMKTLKAIVTKEMKWPLRKREKTSAAMPTKHQNAAELL